MNSELKETIIERLLNIPDEIKVLETNIFKYNEKLLSLKQKKDVWELKTLSEIQSELNEQNKPKYSNETLRNSELENRKNAEYKKILSKIELYSNNIQEQKIEFNFLNNIQSNYKSLIHLIKND
jgi:hypothetical protein